MLPLNPSGLSLKRDHAPNSCFQRTLRNARRRGAPSVRLYFQKREGAPPGRDQTARVVHWLTQPTLNLYALISVFTSIAPFTALCFLQGWFTAVDVHLLGSLVLPRILPLCRRHHLRKIRDWMMNHPAGIKLELVALGVLASDLADRGRRRISGCISLVSEAFTPHRFASISLFGRRGPERLEWLS